MSTRTCLALVVLLIAFASDPTLLATQRAQGRTPPSMCAADEQVVFSAAVLRSKKFASLCASRQLDSTRGYVQYRFGRPGSVELEFPATRAGTQRQFCYGRYTSPGVTYLVVAFQAAGVRYEIRDNSNERDASPESGPQESAWIAVIQAATRRPLTRLALHLPATGSLMHLEDVVVRLDQPPCSIWGVPLG